MPRPYEEIESTHSVLSFYPSPFARMGFFVVLPAVAKCTNRRTAFRNFPILSGLRSEKR
jgi:hypothetical protein